MLRRLLRWLVCPICHDELNLYIADAETMSLNQLDCEVMEAIVPIQDVDNVNVSTGALSCSSCRVYYPIHRGVPRMLGYATEVAHVHARENALWIERNLGGFALPDIDPPRGEAEVLRNFSTEWTAYEWDGESYWNTSTEAALTIKRYELGLTKHSLTQRLVLEVGIGIGGTADGLSKSEDCEIIGMDLGYAVDQAQHYFGKNPRFHIVQASVFLPPFRAGTFDAVYSHGVLHHTYSTPAAFKHIAALPKEKHGMLYVWLYSHEQERATAMRRMLMAIESVCRPLLSRLPSSLQTVFLLPTLPFYIFYQNVYARRHLGTGIAATYGWNEALHAARDRLTPPFAYRHSYNEVLEWFRKESYNDFELLRDEKLPEGVPETYPLNIGIRGFRNCDAA